MTCRFSRGRAGVNKTAARIPPWLIPNALALDAPIVAVVWQRFLASQFGVFVPVLASAILALVVWGVYLLDHAADARRGATATDRHRLAAAYPRAFAVAVAVAFGAAAVGCAFLSVAIVWAGVVVAAGVGGYLGLIHLPASNTLADVGLKELLVGIGFAAGVSVPLVAGSPVGAWLPAVGAFGWLCWLNCRLIDRWEGPNGCGLAELFLAAGTVVVTLSAPSRVAVAVNAAVVLLAVVYVWCRHRPRLARVLADAALLTPLLLGG